MLQLRNEKCRNRKEEKKKKKNRKKKKIFLKKKKEKATRSMRDFQRWLLDRPGAMAVSTLGFPRLECSTPALELPSLLYLTYKCYVPCTGRWGPPVVM